MRAPHKSTHSGLYPGFWKGKEKKNQHEYGLTFHKWGHLSDKTRIDEVKVTGCCSTAADITDKSSLYTLVLLNSHSWGVLVQK